MREVANNDGHRRIKLAEMAMAEVTDIDVCFYVVPGENLGSPALCSRAPQPLWEYVKQATDLSKMELYGPESLTTCRPHRNANQRECDFIPVGYSLVGGRCWKAVRDGLE